MKAARSTRRSIGRPRPVPGVDVREQLLDAAVSLFAERGIAGTTIADIAARAGVTSALVHYYFRNRDRLVDSVAKERVMRSITAVWAPVKSSSSPASMLHGLVQRILQETARNPWLPSLWLREIISEGGQLRARLLKSLPLELISHLIGHLTAAKGRGEMHPNLDPRLALTSIIGLTLLPLATMPLWKQIPALQSITREDIARHAEALLVSAFSRTTDQHFTAG